LDTVTVISGDTERCPTGIGALASRSTAIGGSAVLAARRAVAERRARDEPTPITVDIRHEAEGQAWGYGVYLSELSIDQDNGAPKLRHLYCLDDAGRIITPWAVEGQIRGGVAQGIGEALFERMVFDQDGQLLAESFMDYALPRASDIPPLTIDKTGTPSPMNILGAKGVGEAGTIGAPAAILNAGLDALSLLGIIHLDMPLTPCTLWTAI